MASSKESSASKPQSQHRLSMPSQPSSLPVRQSSARHHSHSVSLGAMNPAHRVTRRKSMTSTAATNAAAIAAIIREGGDSSTISTTSNRRSLGSRKGLESTSMGTNSCFGNYLSRSNGGSNEEYTTARKTSADSAVDGEVDDGEVTEKGVSTKNRSRRASEGSQLIRGEGKRVSGELRCDTCGKGYKHSSCLTKHMWEHDPAWAYTSKLLISKHQQVQLLEAATVLVNMNVDGPTPPETPRVMESDGSSASPTASGSSDLHDELSSTETTPPPMSEEASFVPTSGRGQAKRLSSSSSGFSRSYHSRPSSSIFTGSAPSVSPGSSHFRQSSLDQRPGISGTGNFMSDDDEAGLAAAVELCNFGTPRTGPVHISSDVPPVPPLPARFLGHNAYRLSGSIATPTVYNPLGMHPPMTHKLSDERDVKMEEYDRNGHDDDFSRRLAHVDDDDDGVFGRMEE